MCLPLPNPLAQLSFWMLTSDLCEQPTRKWIVLKGIDWFVVYRWLFISFHTGGLTCADPSVDQSAEIHDLHPFATVLISFDGPRFWVGVVKWSPAVPWLKKDAARLLHFMPTISSCRMSNTLNLMYQQILLNYLYVVEVCARVCLCACLVALNGVHMSVYVQLSKHTQACWCLHVRGGWSGRGRVCRFAGMSVWDEVTHPATHCRGMRKLAFK